MKYVAYSLVVALCLQACGTGGEDGEEIVFQDKGTLCVFDAEPQALGFWVDEPQSYASDAPVYIGVDADACLSSSCDKITQQTCSVTRDGNTLTVTSTLAYENTSEEGEACTADCGALAVACDSEPLPAGTYTIIHGETTRELTIPSESDVPCSM